jgi:hypothetical protein
MVCYGIHYVPQAACLRVVVHVRVDTVYHSDDIAFVDKISSANSARFCAGNVQCSKYMYVQRVDS